MRLETDRLVLRDFDPDDAEAMHAIEGDPLAVRYQSYAPRTLDECRAYIARDAADRAKERWCFDLAVTSRADGTLIGRVGLDQKAPDRKQAALWFILSRALWGKGLMPEAARALVGFGFRERGLHRVWMECDARNRGALRLAEKLGMRREGWFREDAWVKGEWCDSVWFGVLAREWG